MLAKVDLISYLEYNELNLPIMSRAMVPKSVSETKKGFLVIIINIPFFCCCNILHSIVVTRGFLVTRLIFKLPNAMSINEQKSSAGIPKKTTSGEKTGCV